MPTTFIAKLPRRSRSCFVLATLVGLLAAAPAYAQGVTGSALTGTIRGEQGEAVPGAIVDLANQATGATFSAITEESGRYFFDNLPPGGPYALTVNAPGYEPTGRRDVQLALGTRLTLDVTVKAEAEVIEIEEELDTLYDRGRTGAATTVGETAIARLPLQGRNFTDLTSTAPQVSGSSVAGQNNRYNNIQIDGGANNDLFGLSGSGTPGGTANAKPLSIEAIDQFVIQIAPFDVRQGSFAGGLVNAITKSGTNELHGALFGYLQDKSLAGFRDDPTFNDYNTWQYGGFVGGPILRDKLHFFASLDLQTRSSTFGNQFQLTGDQTADLAAAGFDVATAQRFRDILVDQYGYPDPGDGLAPDLENPDRNLFVKVSSTMIPNSNAELSYNLVDARLDVLTRAPTAPTVPFRLRDGYQLSGSGFDQLNTTHTTRFKLTTGFGGGKYSNELLAGVSIIRDNRDPDSGFPMVLVKAGQLGAADSWLAGGAERFSQTSSLFQDVVQLQDNVTVALGDHRLTVGTSNEFFKVRNEFLQASTGVWAFESLDALEAGTPIAFQRRFGVSDAQDPGVAAFEVVQLGLYAQDEWTLRSNLSLSGGIRIDVPFLSDAPTNPVLVDNRALPIDTSDVPSGNVLWSPRAGFNWDVAGDTQTIVRGGTGVFSGRPPYVWVANAYGVNGLSQVELTCTMSSGVPAFNPNPNAQPSDCAGGTGMPPAPTNQGEIDYLDPDTKYPQNFRVALGVDRRLPYGLVATTDLLYTRDLNAFYVQDENLVFVGSDGDGRPLYGSFDTMGFRALPTRVDPVNLTQAVRVSNKGGGRVYNGTLQLTKELDWLAFSLAYTYSDSRDRMSLTSSQALSNFQFSPLDGKVGLREVRPSAFDRHHKITLTGSASLPYGFGVGLAYVRQSGLPYSWTVNGDVNADGINGNDLVFVPQDPSQNSLADPEQWQDLDTLIEDIRCLRNARGRFIQRGACRNPWQQFVNVRFSWTSMAVRGQRFEAQLDIFNVLNLLNSDWGLQDQATGFESHPSAFLRAVGYDQAAQRPIYSFSDPGPVERTIYSPTSSRWRIQLGARYLF